MSKIGERLLKFPSECSVKVTQGVAAIVQGPKGKLTVPLKPFVSVKIQEGTPKNSLLLSVVDPEVTLQRAMWGTTNSLIKNAIEGAYFIICLVFKRQEFYRDTPFQLSWLAWATEQPSNKRMLL